jgi:hypothetical protein
MLSSKGYINRLRNISTWLFIVPLCGLVFSLLLHNLLITYKYKSGLSRYNVSFPITINCTEKNFYCTNGNINLPAKNYEALDECNKFLINHRFILDGKTVQPEATTALDYVVSSGLIKQNELQTPKDIDLKIVYYEKKELQSVCIKNSRFYNLYKIFPQPFVLLEKIIGDKKYISGTSGSVNPFIYGEVSISNIVKRFPINYIFKPLLFITSFFMILYWLTYQRIFWNITEIKKINKFTIFGTLSGVFLFFHVFFLGTTIDNEIFHKIRKLVLVLFILFEILAQFFLTKRLYLNVHEFSKYISKKVLNIKIIFVTLIVLSSVIIISILSFNNLDSKIDYILEWNYFALLLFFYLLSALMWKKRDKKSIL